MWHGRHARVFKLKVHGRVARATNMAKKKTSNTGMNKRIKARDNVTLSKIVELADDVEKSAYKGKDISLAIPTRTRSNTLWNKKRGILEMGDAKSTRE